MRNKSLGLGLVIGLLAMAFAALPAIASASPALTTSKGALVPVGTTVSATSTDSVSVLNGLGTLECKHVEVHGIVTVNNGAEVEISMDGSSDTAEECTLGGLPTTVSPTLTTISLTAAAKTATFDFTGAGGLVTENTVPPGASVIYTGPTSTVLIEGELEGRTTGTFSGHFTLLGGLVLDS